MLEEVILMKYFFFDIDGTLTNQNSNGVILDSTFKTLEKLKADIDNLKLSDSLTLVVSDVDVTLEIDGNYSN